MDYYASHRMTSDFHMRIHENGVKMRLDALRSMCRSSENPVEAKRLVKEFVETNRKTANELIRKGFTLFTINMAIQSGYAGTKKW